MFNDFWRQIDNFALKISLRIIFPIPVSIRREQLEVCANNMHVAFLPEALAWKMQRDQGERTSIGAGCCCADHFEPIINVLYVQYIGSFLTQIDDEKTAGTVILSASDAARLRICLETRTFRLCVVHASPEKSVTKRRMIFSF